MSDDTGRDWLRLRLAQREADLVANRIRQLQKTPIKGTFDVVHLKAIHAHIFQDLPHHKPGQMRQNTPDWTKERSLEGGGGRYPVPYVSRGVEAHIGRALNRFGGPKMLKGLSPQVATERLTELYSDLDHGHGFHEGNSRTLREFTRELAAGAGLTLDWVGTGVGKVQRNALYLARDLAVYARAFPGLTEDRVNQTNDRREVEAFFTASQLRTAVGERTLQSIIKDCLSRRPEMRRQLLDQASSIPQDVESEVNQVRAKAAEKPDRQKVETDLSFDRDDPHIQGEGWNVVFESETAGPYPETTDWQSVFEDMENTAPTQSRSNLSPGSKRPKRT